MYIRRKIFGKSKQYFYTRSRYIFSCIVLSNARKQSVWYDTTIYSWFTQ